MSSHITSVVNTDVKYQKLTKIIYKKNTQKGHITSVIRITNVILALESHILMYILHELVS